MFCRNCGAKLPDGAKFCTECGEKVIRKEDINAGIEQNVQPVVENALEVAVPAVTEIEAVIASEATTESDEVTESARETSTSPEAEAVLESVSEETTSTETETSTEQFVRDEKVYEESDSKSQQTDNTSQGNKEAKDWRDYVTDENVERYTPIIAMFPLVMSIVTGILGGVLLGMFGHSSVVSGLCKVVLFGVKLVFVVCALCGTIKLISLVLNKKDKNDVKSWIVPGICAVATLSCIGTAFGGGFFSGIFGFVSVIFGLEFIARIVIAGQPMESSIHPRAAVEVYKQFFEDCKNKKTTKQENDFTNKNETNAASDNQTDTTGTSGASGSGTKYYDLEGSEFDGMGIELFGYIVLAQIVSVITCGIATPWMLCMIYRWKMEHTTINGKRLTFNGEGGSLLGHWILWELLTIITCGIYGLFVHVQLRKWELSHTFIEGEPIMVNGNESYFDGGNFEFIAYSIAASFLILITCGLAFPWAMTMLQTWDTKHQVINSRRLEFNGTGIEFMGEFILIVVLNLITCGIYSPWGIVRMNKFITRHTNFVN